MLIAKMHVPPEQTKLLRNRHDQIIQFRSLERKQLRVWQPFTSRCFFNIHGQTVPDYFRIRTLYYHFVSYAVWRKETNIPENIPVSLRRYYILSNKNFLLEHIWLWRSVIFAFRRNFRCLKKLQKWLRSIFIVRHKQTSVSWSHRIK